IAFDDRVVAVAIAMTEADAEVALQAVEVFRDAGSGGEQQRRPFAFCGAYRLAEAAIAAAQGDGNRNARRLGFGQRLPLSLGMVDGAPRLAADAQEERRRRRDLVDVVEVAADQPGWW